MRGKGTLDSFFAAQFGLPLLFAFGGSFIPDNTAFWVFALAIVGYMSPDFWLTRKTGQRRHKIRRSIPDCLDLLVICVDAGLGLDQALLRVGSELAISHPEINEELTQINLEQRAGKPRLEAWQGVAERTQIEEFKAFVSMLVQTDKFGTPILKALNQFSEEIRPEKKAACRGSRSQDKDQDHLPAGSVHFSVRVYCFAGAGSSQYRERLQGYGPLEDWFVKPNRRLAAR